MALNENDLKDLQVTLFNMASEIQALKKRVTDLENES